MSRRELFSSAVLIEYLCHSHEISYRVVCSVDTNMNGCGTEFAIRHVLNEHN